MAERQIIDPPSQPKTLAFEKIDAMDMNLAELEKLTKALFCIIQTLDSEEMTHDALHGVANAMMGQIRNLNQAHENLRTQFRQQDLSLVFSS